MSTDFKNITSPCTTCPRVTEFDKDSEVCCNCKYNIAMQILKKELKASYGCVLCKYRDEYGDCSLNISEKEACVFDIDFKSAFEEYQIIN